MVNQELLQKMLGQAWLHEQCCLLNRVGKFCWLPYSIYCNFSLLPLVTTLKYRSENFERTFWYPQILPKTERTNSFLVLLCLFHFIFDFLFFVSFGEKVINISLHFQEKTVQLIFSFFVILNKIRKPKNGMNQTWGKKNPNSFLCFFLKNPRILKVVSKLSDF